MRRLESNELKKRPVGEDKIQNAQGQLDLVSGGGGGGRWKNHKERICALKNAWRQHDNIEGEERMGS